MDFQLVCTLLISLNMYLWMWYEKSIFVAPFFGDVVYSRGSKREGMIQCCMYKVFRLVEGVPTNCVQLQQQITQACIIQLLYNLAYTCHYLITCT